MAISYTPTDIRGKAVEPILEEMFFANKTVAKGYVTFNDGIKAGTIFTEAGIDVAAQLYTGQALSSSGSIAITDRYITPIKLEYKQTFLEEALRTSRFNRDMAVGAWNIESNEFSSLLMSLQGKAISEDAEKQFWNGFTTAGKAGIAAGDFSAAAKARVAAQTTTFVDGVISKVLYDNSTNGTCVRVTGTTLSASNISVEYAKIYAAIPAVVLADTSNPPLMYAPYRDKQLMKIANNSVGAAQQINFMFEGAGDNERCYYNGVEVVFVPMANDFVYVNRPVAVSWNTDLVDDLARLEIGKVANDGDLKFMRAIYTLNANVGQAANGVLYGA